MTNLLLEKGEPKMMVRSVVSADGWMVIPIRLRNQMGIKKGTEVVFKEKDGDIIIHPVTKTKRTRK